MSQKSDAIYIHLLTHSDRRTFRSRPVCIYTLKGLLPRENKQISGQKNATNVSLWFLRVLIYRAHREFREGVAGRLGYPSFSFYLPPP